MIDENSPSDFSILVERSLVDLVAKRVQALGLSHARFAASVWPELPAKSASVRWAVIRTKSSNTGRPQGALIRDAFRMAEVLGDDLGYLLALATEEAKTAKKAKDRSDK